ncbi:hypothetical protein [Streptomyces erythrochromogenes]|uniref:hypothetical protein n=1 Tax=Streptomyces erythrochromogenes TaxID=285574 RepID=UPI0036AF6D8B
MTMTTERAVQPRSSAALHMPPQAVPVDRTAARTAHLAGGALGVEAAKSATEIGHDVGAAIDAIIKIFT